MSEYVIKPMDVLKIILGYRKSISVMLTVSMGLVVLTYIFLPRVFTSEVTIHISGNYFQNPLLGDLVSQIYDPGEVREEREKIIRSSLSAKFAAESGEKYHLFKSEASDLVRRPQEIEAFLKGVHTFGMTSTQFKIRLRAPSPEAADGLIHDAVNAVRESMYTRRTKMLQGLLEVLSNEISHTGMSESVGVGGDKAAPLSATEAAKTQIAAQIARLDEHLTELRTKYNEQHPTIQKVKGDITRLRARSRGTLMPELGNKGFFDLDKAGGAPLGSITKDELVKRRHMVNMSYEMEKRDPSMSAYVSVIEEPTYPKRTPKRRVFAIAALIAALLSTLLPPALGEYWRRMPRSPGDLSESLGIPVLGLLSIPKTDREH